MKKLLLFTIVLSIILISGCSSIMEDYKKGEEIGKRFVQTLENYNLVEITIDSNSVPFNGVIYGVLENGSIIYVGSIEEGTGLYNKSFFNSYLIEANLNGSTYLSKEISGPLDTLNLESEDLKTKKYIFYYSETSEPIGKADVYVDEVFIETLGKTSIFDSMPKDADILLINGSYEGKEYEFFWEINKLDDRGFIIPLYISKQKVIDSAFADSINVGEVRTKILELLSQEGLNKNADLDDIASEAHLEYLNVADDLNMFIFNEVQDKGLSFYERDWFVEEVVVYEGKDYISILKDNVLKTYNSLIDENNLKYSDFGTHVECYSGAQNSYCEVFVLVTSNSHMDAFSLDGLSYTYTAFFQNVDRHKIHLEATGRHVFNAYILDISDEDEFNSRFVYNDGYQSMDFKKSWLDITKINEELIVSDSDILIIENSLEIENDYTYTFKFVE